MSGESIQAKDFSTRFEVGKSVGDNSKTEGSLERLQSLFQDRFRQMKKFIATNYGLTDTLKLKDI